MAILVHIAVHVNLCTMLGPHIVADIGLMQIDVYGIVALAEILRQTYPFLERKFSRQDVVRNALVLSFCKCGKWCT